MSGEVAMRDEVLDALEFDLIVERLTDEGLGYGHGKISRETREELEGNEDLAALTDEALNDPRILTPISTDENGEPLDDDGCGDGRRTGLVFRRVGHEAVEEIASEGVDEVYVDEVYKSSLVRSKVFGGALAMAMAGEIGLGRARSLKSNEAFEAGRAKLHQRSIDYGAHTALRAHDDKTGCGAVDEQPEILRASVTYRDAIRNTIVGLVGPAPELDEMVADDGTVIPGILDNFAEAAGVDNSEYDSREVMNGTVNDGKVVKALADDHFETRIALNYVKGHTVDQSFVREYTGERAQVFSVDVWRMVEIAERMYDDPAEQRRALISELVYTLATAAVLTKGDLPIVAYKAAPKEQPVEA